MAWLQNLAGKAEDLLNKIDQNAANVLNESSKTSENLNSSFVESGEANQNYPLLQSSYQILNEQLSSGKLHRRLSESGVKDNPSNDTTLPLKQDDEMIYLKLDSNAKDSNDDKNVQRTTMELSTSSPKISTRTSFHVQDDVQLNDEEKLVKYETENVNLNKQLLNLQHLYSELQNDNLNLQNQIERANESVTSAQSEMEQYKSRAQRILQEKESLISLQQHEVAENVSDDILNTYNEELKRELEFQQEKNKELSEKVVNLKNDLVVLQQLYVKVQNANKHAIHNLQELLENERRIRTIAEDDCRIKTNELQATLNELTQHQINLRNVSLELEKMRAHLKESTNLKSNDDSESRLHTLTQTLMMKQNTLETVTTERNALRIQLEKLENQYQRALLQNQRKHVISDINDTDDAKSQVPRLMVVSPFDAGVTRRVKHAYSSLDAISIRTGVFLRRYPLARIFVFCYMILLHIWMLVILYTYVPN